MDTLKDRLYSDAPASVTRRAAQTVLLNILWVLVRQLAPLLSFTCDEVLEYFPEGLRYEGFPEAVALAGWPTDDEYIPAIAAIPAGEAGAVGEAGEAERILEDFAVALGVRDAVTKALEEARAEKIVGKSQEARVEVALAPLAAEVLQRLPEGTLEDLLIVGEVHLTVREGLSEPRVNITRAAGEKCPRCWNIRELGTDAAHPAVCGRCAAVLTELGFEEAAVES
jgi:isoleucyl-tRNA synthetase